MVDLPRPTSGSAPAWHLYVVGHSQVESLERALAGADIGHKAYYRTPVHRQPPMRGWGARADLPATDHAAARHLAIPMNPLLTPEQAAEVAAAARAA